MNYEYELKTFFKEKCQCLKNKKSNRIEKAPLVKIKSTQLFELLSIDYLELDESKEQYKYLLVDLLVSDHFSKYAQPFQRKNKSAASEILFSKCFLDFGFYQRILDDQEREFDNKMLEPLEEPTGIKQSRTTPYHPIGNGHFKRILFLYNSFT